MSGSTALHIAASRGQLRFVKKMCWSLYHKLGGSSTDPRSHQSAVAFHMVRDLLNSSGGKRGQGVVDMALGANVETAMYLKNHWNAVEQVPAPARRPGPGYW